MSRTVTVAAIQSSFGPDAAENIAKIDESRLPPEIPVKELLREAHRELYVPKKKS